MRNHIKLYSLSIWHVLWKRVMPWSLYSQGYFIYLRNFKLPQKQREFKLTGSQYLAGWMARAARHAERMSDWWGCGDRCPLATPDLANLCPCLPAPSTLTPPTLLRALQTCHTYFISKQEVRWLLILNSICRRLPLIWH